MTAPHPTPTTVFLASQDILSRVYLKNHFIGSILITSLLLFSSPLCSPNNAKRLQVTESRCLSIMRESSSSPGHWVNVKEHYPRPCPWRSSFHYQGSQCWLCNPQTRKLVEDSGCVCLFYYHRLIIAREVRGLTSISSNCCETCGPLPRPKPRPKTFPVQRLGPGVQGDMPNSFKVFPLHPAPIFMPFFFFFF